MEMDEDENGTTVRVICKSYQAIETGTVEIPSVGMPYFCPKGSNHWTGDEHCKCEYVCVLGEEEEEEEE